MGEWVQFKIGDLITLEYGKSLKGYRENIGNYDVFGTNGKIGSTDSYLYDQPSIVIGRKGAYRGVELALKPFYVIDTAFYTKLKTYDLDVLFLYYWFLLIDINNMDSGSAIPSTSRDEVYDLEIFLPSLNNQKAIAEVLSSLDDKIDLLHRQNKTLEGLAETLFRQMFIENVQDDWEEGTLRDLLELHYGKGLKKSIRTGSGFPVVGSSGIVDYHDEYFVEGPGIVIGRKGTLGKVIYLTGNFFPIDTTYYVKPTPGYGFIFTYYLLKIQDYKEMNTDSAVPGLNRDIALSVELKVPSPEMAEEFESICLPIFERRSKNIKQIQSLENLRDTLLPKLMNGEIRVKYQEV